MMNNIPSNISFWKRRSSIFKPTFDNGENSKNILSEFLELHQEKHVPIIWERLSCGYRIVDFQINRIKEAFDLLQMYYFCINESCAASSLYINYLTIKTYQQFILDVALDNNSFYALEEGTGKMIGVAMASINTNYFMEAEFRSTKDLFDAVQFEKNLLDDANIHDIYNVDQYFCIHTICVKPGYYNKGVGAALVRACLSKAFKTGHFVCIGIFPYGPSQTIARRFGFEILAELPIINIKTSDLGYLHHDLIENNFVSCMGIKMLSIKENKELKSDKSNKNKNH